MSKKKDPKTPIDDAMWADFQCNLSALMYVVAEQQALIGKLLEELVRVGALNTSALDRLTSSYKNEEILTGVYTQIYERFEMYFRAVRALLRSQGDLPDDHEPEM